MMQIHGTIPELPVMRGQIGASVNVNGGGGSAYKIGYGLELDKATNTLSAEVGKESFEEIPNTKVQEIFNKVMNG